MEQNDKTKDINHESSQGGERNGGLILGALVLMVIIYKILTIFIDVFQRYKPLFINIDESVKVTLATVITLLDLGSVIYVIWLINSGGFNSKQTSNARFSAFYLSAMFPLAGGIALIFLFGLFDWGGILGFTAIPLILLFLLIELRKRKLEKTNPEEK